MTRENLSGVRWIGMEPTPTGDISHMRVEIHSHDEDNDLAPTVVTLGANAVDILIQHHLEEDGAFRIEIGAHGVTSNRDLARLFRHYASMIDEDHEDDGTDAGHDA